jgi:hypothetical protein
MAQCSVVNLIGEVSIIRCLAPPPPYCMGE